MRMKALLRLRRARPVRPAAGASWRGGNAARIIIKARSCAIAMVAGHATAVVEEEEDEEKRENALEAWVVQGEKLPVPARRK